MSLVCDHGLFITDCAVCEKREGECDYGACESDAVSRVVYIRLGKVVDARPVCAAHIDAMTCAGALPDGIWTEVRS